MRSSGKYVVAAFYATFVCTASSACTYDFDGLVAQTGGGAGGAGGMGGAGGVGGSSGASGSDDGGENDGSGGTSGSGGAAGGSAGKGGSGGSGGSGGTTVDAGRDGSAGKSGTADAAADRAPDAIVDVRAEQAFDCSAVGGTVYQGHCYYPSNPTTNWDTANTTACAAPSHLVVITTLGEQNVVATIAAGRDRWIGLRKEQPPNMESSFRWVTGEALAHRQWDVYDTGAPEPNYTGDCVRMRPTNNWGDTGCAESYSAVCERE